jgi:hypothetical protein
MLGISEPLNHAQTRDGPYSCRSIAYANAAFRNESHSARQTCIVLIGAWPPVAKYRPRGNIIDTCEH